MGSKREVSPWEGKGFCPEEGGRNVGRYLFDQCCRKKIALKGKRILRWFSKREKDLKRVFYF